MIVNMIVARDDNWGIGFENRLPWPLCKEDMKWFRDNTIGDMVIMGRKTWQSIGSKKLPGRINIVVSSKNIDGADVSVNGSMEKIIDDLKGISGGKNLWVIGGADIYRQSIPFCEHVYITTFFENYHCDAFLDPTILDGFTKISSKSVKVCEFSIWSRV